MTFFTIAYGVTLFAVAIVLIVLTISIILDIRKELRKDRNDKR